MKICFINHCCPVKRKSNHRWGHAFSKFLMHGNYEAGCIPTQWNQTWHIHTGASARTGRSLTGKLLAAGTGGRGDVHTACKGARYFQCTCNADLESSECCSEPSPLQEPLAWDELRGDVQRPPWQFDVCLPLTPKGRTLLHCQYWLWNLSFNIHADDIMQWLTINDYFSIKEIRVVQRYFFLPRVRIAFIL